MRSEASKVGQIFVPLRKNEEFAGRWKKKRAKKSSQKCSERRSMAAGEAQRRQQNEEGMGDYDRTAFVASDDR